MHKTCRVGSGICSLSNFIYRPVLFTHGMFGSAGGDLNPTLGQRGISAGDQNYFSFLLCEVVSGECFVSGHNQ
jgi:hypothetical protein